MTGKPQWIYDATPLQLTELLDRINCMSSATVMALIIWAQGKAPWYDGNSTVVRIARDDCKDQ